MNRSRSVYLLLVLLFLSFTILLSCKPSVEQNLTERIESVPEKEVHFGPDTASIPDDEFGEMVRYGRELILNTAYYIGPEGKAGKYLGNKMNCTNCHLDAGTRPYGLNFLSTHGRYPQYRSRENRILRISERINNCIERPHNGKPLPLESREMTAIVCYIKWLGQGVPAGQRVEGDSGMEVKLPDYPLDVKHGERVYMRECARCHGNDGAGQMREDNVTYTYPPLWGMKSYQPGSSMYRIVKAAQFIKANMPYDQATWQKPKLTDRDALDVAAYVNSEKHERPEKGGVDYPNIATKPIDYPFGPFNDTFPELQHKYGPFKPIMEYRKARGLVVKF